MTDAQQTQVRSSAHPQHGSRRREWELLTRMVQLTCTALHSEHLGPERVCPECQALLVYAAARLAGCPYGDRKPVCRRCPKHCYRPVERARMRAVMRYAGPRLARRFDLDALRHLLHGLLIPPPNK